MTIRHLKIFISVADFGKMSLAAEKLYLSQPTISQAIHELEEHYHVLLFERLSKKLYITEAGKQLLCYARQVVKQFEILEAKMVDLDGKEHLQIGTSLTIGSYLMPKLIRDLERACPQTETYTYVGNTRLLEEKLLRAELNVAIVEGNVKSQDLISIPIVEDFLVLACSKQHPFAKKKEIYANELEGQMFVMREPGSATRALFDAYLEKRGLCIQNKIETNGIDIIRNAVLENGCLSVVSVRLLEQEIKERKVVVFCNSSADWNRTFNLVYHKDKYITSSIQTLGSLLSEYKRTDFLKYSQIGWIRENK